LFLKRFVIALILGLWYVNVVHFSLSAVSGFGLGFLCFSFLWSLWSTCDGTSLFFPIVFMVSHSLCLLSWSSGKLYILFMWCRYAAIFCSVGWFDWKFIVVSVAVGFRCMSIWSRLCIRVIVRSKKSIALFSSGVAFSLIF